MATSKAEGKRSLKEMEDDDEEEDDEDGSLGFGVNNEDDKKSAGKKGKKGSSGSGVSMPPISCQAENCTVDMSDAKKYHKRHKVCAFHAKAPYVLVSGIHQRFCQQCSRFHEISEFDDTKRSCRRRLAGHNERRRKSSAEYQGDGSN